MALTKVLKFDGVVLDVLRRMTWDGDGTLGLLPKEQLDRKLYVEVNKALEAMGGKWNRGKAGHVFASDPRAQVAGLLDAGTLTVVRDGFFETPRAVVERMLELVPYKKGMTVLEPEAGRGAIARVLVENGADDLLLIEKDPLRCEALAKEFGRQCVWCGDFLTWDTDVINGTRKRFDRVYMNPPFEEGQDAHHVMHAYGLLANGGKLVSVMGEGVFFRSDLQARKFQEFMLSVGAENERLPEHSFRESGTDVNTRLVWMTKE